MSEDKKKKGLFSKRNLLIGCGGLLGIFILLLAFGTYLNSTPAGKATNTAEAIAQATEDAKPTETPIPSETPQPTTTPRDTLTPENKLIKNIQDTLGDGNRDVPRTGNITTNCTDQGCDIVVNWAIDDNFSTNLIRVGAQTDATDILEQIKKSDLDINSARLLGSFVMVDSYGNESEDIVVNLLFSSETIEKINFDNFIYTNIYRIADEADIHPQLIPEQ